MRANMVDVISADISKAVKKNIKLSGTKLGLLIIVDFLMIQTLVNSLNVMSWRGVWELHEIWISELTKVNTFDDIC